MLESNITLIITTKNYPLLGWEDSGVLNCEVEKLDFYSKDELLDSYKKKGTIPSISIKKLCVNHFSVFVVPCLSKSKSIVSDEDRRCFLESLITTICPDAANKEYDAYLFAHDGDFGKEQPGGAIVTKSDIPAGESKIPALSKLVKARRVYMFQHVSPFDGIVMSIDELDKSGRTRFGECQCKKIVEIIDAERLMCQYFEEINRGRIPLPAPLSGYRVCYNNYPFIDE